MLTASHMIDVWRTDRRGAAVMWLRPNSTRFPLQLALGGTVVDEQQHEVDKLTAITHTWRINGPMSPAQRKEAKALFLEELKRVHVVMLACEYAHVSRQTAYQWKEKDTAFAEQWENATERSKDIARSSIYQRGILGWDEPVISMGQVVYEYEPMLDEQGKPQLDSKGKPIMRRGNLQTVHKWSDSLAMGYAKANLPEYKDRQQIDLTAQITTMAETAKDELLADLSVAIAREDQEYQQE